MKQPNHFSGLFDTETRILCLAFASSESWSRCQKDPRRLTAVFIASDKHQLFILFIYLFIYIYLYLFIFIYIYLYLFIYLYFILYLISLLSSPLPLSLFSLTQSFTFPKKTGDVFLRGTTVVVMPVYVVSGDNMEYTLVLEQPRLATGFFFVFFCFFLFFCFLFLFFCFLFFFLCVFFVFYYYFLCF